MPHANRILFYVSLLCGGFPGTACYGQEVAILPAQVNVQYSRIYTFVDKTGITDELTIHGDLWIAPE